MHHNSKVPLVKPPDGGWGWVIVVSCFIVTVCTRAVSRCFSIFFMEFQNYFAQDYAMTAWIHSTVDCTTMMFAPVGSIISNRYSSRASVVLGGLLASAGLILSSFANCLEYLYLSLGVLTGCGYALAYTPSVAIVGEYFHKRKAMAYGIAMSGTGIGTFVLAPVVQLLIEKYSWRGALLILGGLVLNICACGALLRPLTLADNLTGSTVTEKVTEECTYKVQHDDLPLHCSAPHSVLTKIDCSDQQSCRYCPSYQEYAFLLTPDFLVFAVSVLFLAYGCSTPFVYLIPYAVNVGVSQQQAAFLMSILGIMDIIGTISFGWITDRRCLKKYRRFCFFLTIGLDGFSSLFIPILKTFPLLVPYAFCYGYFDGAYVALLPVVTSDIAGHDFLSSGLGIVYFIHAIPYLIGPPIAGWLVNTTGTYTAAFFISGLSMMFGSLLVPSADWIRSCRNSVKVQGVKPDVDNATFHNAPNNHI
ncbi:monocarboxylate transporter 12-B [Callorhinchus milii]|uniref:Solute carrier family 16 member 12a n=2 Tax=Callorhinchus milii TaxID=7868 RepID=A0A4W3JQR3_CALMI|nr:monocarboxylate transporter 12-B [Callorhinchus milii]XP_042192765.1 monocarboxylate transporter 12-B [Callorhinchus milii]|eukprot:gi/632936450/ref/XP_007895003.1/ PREDICTED: monocarboxylate transporter 12 [Callorhinchus milii]